MNSEYAWYVIRTKPRQEDRAVENLTFWGIDTLAPKFKEANGRRDSHLFPGYIFARFDAAEMLHNVHFTRGVSYVVNFGGVPAAISDELINEIHARTDEGGGIRNTVMLNPGDTVIIRSGLLRDFIGVFERDLPGSERVQILLRNLAYNAHAEVYRCDVAKLAS